MTYLILDELPDDTGHLVTINVDDRVCYLDALVFHSLKDISIFNKSYKL